MAAPVKFPDMRMREAKGVAPPPARLMERCLRHRYRVLALMHFRRELILATAEMVEIASDKACSGLRLEKETSS